MALTDIPAAVPPLAILLPSSVARNVDTDLIFQAFASCTSREMQREQDEVGDRMILSLPGSEKPLPARKHLSLSS